jgi:hypothetical protein
MELNAKLRIGVRYYDREGLGVPGDMPGCASVSSCGELGNCGKSEAKEENGSEVMRGVEVVLGWIHTFAGRRLELRKTKLLSCQAITKEIDADFSASTGLNLREQ